MPGPASVSNDGESSFTTGPATEHTRLLPQSGGTVTFEYSPSPQTLKRWATISLAAAIPTLVLLLSCWIILRTTFRISPTWALDDGIPPLALFTFLSLVFSLPRYSGPRVFAGTSTAPPSVIAVIFAFLADSFLALAIIGWALNLLSVPEYNYCAQSFDPVENCPQWVLALRVLLCTATGFAVIAGLSHVVLALMRFISMCQASFWARQLSLGFSDGQFSFEIFFGVRAMRQPHIAPSEVDERTEGETEGGTTEAGTER